MFPADCSDEKKAQFVNYLEKHNILKTFSDIFDKLMKCKERPENPIDFIRQELGDDVIPEETFENLERELEETHREIASLKKAIEELDLEEGVEDDEVTGEAEEEAGPSTA